MLYNTYASTTASLKRGCECPEHRCKKTEVLQDLWVWALCFTKAWILTVGQLCSRNVMWSWPLMAGPEHLCPGFFFPTQQCIHTKNIQINWAESMKALPILPRKLVSQDIQSLQKQCISWTCSRSHLSHQISLYLLYFIGIPDIQFWNDQLHTLFLDTVSAEDICSRSLRIISTPERSVRWYL